MSAKTPTLEELTRIASVYHLHLSLDDLRSFQELMAPSLPPTLDSMPLLSRHLWSSTRVVVAISLEQRRTH